MTTESTDGRAVERSVTLAQHFLGDRPYVLIQAKMGDEGPDDLRLTVEAGGGAEEQVSYLPYLMVTSLPADTNPITEALRLVRADVMGKSADLTASIQGASLATLQRVADALGVPL